MPSGTNNLALYQLVEACTNGFYLYHLFWQVAWMCASGQRGLTKTTKIHFVGVFKLASAIDTLRQFRQKPLFSS